MPILIQCNNLGCYKQSEALIDKSTNLVHCADCDKTIDTISHFMKQQLISFGQIKKASKHPNPFAVECKFCKIKELPTIKNNNLYCKSCNKEHTHLLAPFKQMIITQLHGKNS